MNDKIDDLKKEAAEIAVASIHSGMILGLGSGTTFLFALEKIAGLLKEGKLKNILAIPSSVNTELKAKELGIPLIDFSQTTLLDLTIDGADEIDPQLNLIKGGGGALLWEKILAQASRREIIIADESKLSPHLGTKWPVPIEVFQFAAELEREFLESLGAKVKLRKTGQGKPYLTDENNFILDAHFGPINNPAELSSKLEGRAGIAGHGIFIDLADEVIIATSKGIKNLKK